MKFAEVFPNATTSKARTRFTAKINAKSDEGCWLWTAQLNRGGYGVFAPGMPDRTQRLAHRIAVEWSGRELPDDLTVDHLCRNRACVNPRHLEVVPRRNAAWRGSERAEPRNFRLFPDSRERLGDAIVEAVHDLERLSINELEMRFRLTPGWYVRDTILKLVAAARLNSDGQFLELPGPVAESSAMSSSN